VIEPDPHIATPEVRRVRRWVNKLARLLALLEPGPDDSWYRASGRCVCLLCGEDYDHHADDPREPWLTMLCGGQRVKL
jgi:hypothetical protein